MDPKPCHTMKSVIQGDLTKSEFMLYSGILSNERQVRPMTKEDYILLAKIISDLPDREARRTVCNSLMFGLKADNEKFNPTKFEKACSVLKNDGDKTMYETWAVTNWLDNDVGAYGEVRELAKKQKDKEKLAKAIKAYVADLFTTALAKVNWKQIAECAILSAS